MYLPIFTPKSRLVYTETNGGGISSRFLFTWRYARVRCDWRLQARWFYEKHGSRFQQCLCSKNIYFPKQRFLCKSCGPQLCIPGTAEQHSSLDYTDTEGVEYALSFHAFKSLNPPANF